MMAEQALIDPMKQAEPQAAVAAQVLRDPVTQTLMAVKD
jgi:hypothetical protein